MKTKHKTFLCTDHTGPGGPVRVHRDVPRQQQINRVARVLARRVFGREACYGPTHLNSINTRTLACTYGTTLMNRYGPEGQERRATFTLERV